MGLVKLGPQSPSSRGPEDFIASQIADGSGAYHFPKVENVSFSGALVSASRAGYFTDTTYIQMSEDRQLDFDLEPAVYIAVGERISAPVGEARCASFGYGGGGGALCTRFAVAVQATGGLEVTVSSSTPVDVSLLRPDGTIGVYAGGFPPVTAALPVIAGLTYQIEVAHVSPPTGEVELTTTLR